MASFSVPSMVTGRVARTARTSWGAAKGESAAAGGVCRSTTPGESAALVARAKAEPASHVTASSMSTSTREVRAVPGGGVRGVLPDANYDRGSYETVAWEVSENRQRPGKREGGRVLEPLENSLDQPLELPRYLSARVQDLFVRQLLRLPRPPRQPRGHIRDARES